MRSIIFALLLAACVDDPLLDDTGQDLRPRCPASNPDCELPDPPEPPPGHPGHPPIPPDTCNALVTGSVSKSNPSPIALGSSVTIYWDVTMPTTCTPTGQLTFAGVPVLPNGSIVVTPSATRIYSLALEGKNLGYTTVEVQLPKVVRITANTPDQQAMFKQAAGTEPVFNLLTGQYETQTILINPDVELDLTAFASSGIPVASGVKISGESPLPPYKIARTSNTPGPRLYSTVRSTGLLWLKGSNILLRGFRVHGPDMQITDGKGRGIVIESGNNVELDRLEVAGFSEAAIYALDPAGTNNVFADVRIHDSYIHHNQRAPGGDGYGVVVTAGAKVLIEHDVFDYNRHAIASTGGAEGTGYHANENLVLKGGGYHEGVAGTTWATHIFDVHGANNCGVGSYFSDSLGNCGPAGEIYLITKNAFQYDAGLDFKLRGTPSIGAYLTDNIFPHSSEGSTVEQYETGMHLTNNTYNRDTFGTYGTCDFDGDGLGDLFLATGRTWWFSSGGKHPWTYLNAQTEQLSQLGLGDFNHDGRCDVLRERNNTWELSSGGTAQFAPLPAGFSGPISQLRFADFNNDGYTDVFQRVPSGQWYGYFNFTVAQPLAMQSSGKPIEELSFGDFDGDGYTDVLALDGNVWSWSRGGREGWRPLNPRFHDFHSVVMIANVDGIRGDDVVARTTSGSQVQLWVSSGGTTEWRFLLTVPQTTYTSFLSSIVTADTYLIPGRFNHGQPGLLRLDSHDRITTQFYPGTGLLPYGQSAL